MQNSFVLRAAERGHGHYLSTGINATYIAGHPNATLTRQSSFNFHEYQSGRAGFGKIRVFGDEVFSGAGCGYNMHPHHNFVICAFILKGELTHINTVGNIDQLHADDYYVFSAGAGGKHCELNLRSEDMQVIYIWFLPEQLYLPPSYHRGHFDLQANRNQLATLVGEANGVLPIPQDVRISRLLSDEPTELTYRLASRQHGIYTFVIEGSTQVDGVALDRRDSLGLWDIDAVQLKTSSGRNDLLIVETVM
ncbi:pirin family protein [Synechococcus elongatus IITB4]|uniref:pirin family protein n=1 Tax=Synechococcus elongatus TaxID=32046 RepID=UPI0030CBD8FC